MKDTSTGCSNSRQAPAEGVAWLWLTVFQRVSGGHGLLRVASYKFDMGQTQSAGGIGRFEQCRVQFWVAGGARNRDAGINLLLQEEGYAQA
jgi:hypothetical protein